MQRSIQVTREDPQLDKTTTHEFSLTIMNDAGLSRRLISELRFIRERFKQVWPHLKRDPIGFAAQELADFRTRLKKTVSRSYIVTASVVALFLVGSGVFTLLIFDGRRTVAFESSDIDAPVEITRFDFASEEKEPAKSGIGSGQKGRVGFDDGNGEGSKPEPARARGGGGSGKHELFPAQVGKLMQPSEIPAPLPAVAKQNPALPEAGIDIDPALWKDLPFRTYGDPRSKANTASNGPGDGGVIGSGKGFGVGEGDGSGFGPGRERNIGDGDPNIGGRGKGGAPGANPDGYDRSRVYNPPQVTERARVLSKPEPQYTEEGRKNGVTGTVVLRVVFSSSGEVTNIRAVQGLPSGLTEKAIAAARQIRFSPAKRDGHPVSVFMQLEYNFNLY